MNQTFVYNQIFCTLNCHTSDSMAGADDSTLAENAPAVLSKQLGNKVMTTPILVVGAGGIGCELLKNLVLSGFKKITVVSNSGVYFKEATFSDQIFNIW